MFGLPLVRELGEVEFASIQVRLGMAIEAITSDGNEERMLIQSRHTVTW